jgi:putative tricarboxylic transport membrane protein
MESRFGRSVRAITLATGVALAAALGACGAEGAGGGGGGGGGEKEAAWKPTRPVTMIVPFEPGGGSDVLGRTMAAGFEKVRQGVNVSVENRAGAGGAVGYSYLLEQNGNPHFILASETAAVAIPVTTDVPFKWQDFTPAAQIAEDATLLVVDEDSDFRELDDIVRAAKGGRQVTVAVSGATGLDTIVTGLWEKESGVKFERVVFESGGEIVRALLAGDVDIAMLNPSEVIGQLRANNMKAVAVFADKRYEGARLAEVPTAKEEGIDVAFTQYRGLLAAGGIQPPERQYWIDTATMWTEDRSYDKYIEDNFLIPVLRTGDEFTAYLEEYEQQVRTALGK